MKFNLPFTSFLATHFTTEICFFLLVRNKTNKMNFIYTCQSEIFLN